MYDRYILVYIQMSRIITHYSEQVPSKRASAAAGPRGLAPLVTESGRAMEGGRQEEGSVVFEVGSGEYDFKTEYY